MCQSASEKVSGRYEATQARDPGPGQFIELELNEDQTATMRTDYLSEDNAIVQKGSWARNGKDSLTVYFVESEGRLVMDTLGLSIQGSQLILKGDKEDMTLLRRTQ